MAYTKVFQRFKGNMKLMSVSSLFSGVVASFTITAPQSQKTVSHTWKVNN